MGPLPCGRAWSGRRVGQPETQGYGGENAPHPAGTLAVPPGTHANRVRSGYPSYGALGGSAASERFLYRLRQIGLLIRFRK
jgi:hypothetical protein